MENEVFSSNYFTVEIDGIQTDRFFSCEGFEVETSVYEVEESGLNTSTHKRVGSTRYPNLVLKKGVNSNNELINWFQSNEKGKIDRKTLSVVLIHSSGVELKRWNFFRAFPCRWKLQTLDTQDNACPVEIIEIAHG
jgi:phage tail-like protein